MRSLTIAGRVIDDDAPAYVIAELGNNHGGDVRVASQMIRIAAAAGADACKLQKRDNERLYTTALRDAPYANEHSYGPTYGAHRAALELGGDAYRALQIEAARQPVTLFATAFDEASAAFIAEIGMPAIKIHSGGLTDARLLKFVATYQRPVIVSTGGGTLDDIDRAHDLLGDCPHAFLHCTASYPLLPEQANLRVISTLRARYPDTVIGFSSHAPGIALSLVAYAFGARILEHHVTLNRAGKGTDHGFSLEPKGLSTLVDDLAKARAAMGDGVKRFLEVERAPIAKMRRRETEEGWKIGG